MMNPPGELHLLYCDETDIARPDGTRFFMYGGLVVASSQAAGVAGAVIAAREQIGLLPHEPLKFAIRARPERVSPSDWTDAKRSLLGQLAVTGVKVICHLVHERIANQDHKAHWALDAACVEFQDQLGKTNGRGLVVVDHNEGLSRQDLAEIASGETVVSVFRNKLPSIDGVALGHAETVLGLQAADVLLGSIRYCLEKPDHDVSVDLIGSLGRFSGVLETRPRVVKVAAYRADYEALRSEWADLSDRWHEKQTETGNA